MVRWGVLKQHVVPVWVVFGYWPALYPVQIMHSMPVPEEAHVMQNHLTYLFSLTVLVLRNIA